MREASAIAAGLPPKDTRLSPASLWRSIWSQPWLLLGAMALVFGANGAAARLAVGEISPLVLVALRWAFVATFLAVVFGPEDRRRFVELVRHRWGTLGWMGLLGYSGYNALFYIAAYHTTAVNLTLLQSAIPAFVLAGSALVFRTRTTLLQVAGMLLTVVGVLVSAKGDFGRLASLSFNVGDLLVLVACVFYAAFALGLRGRPATASPLVFFAGLALSSFLWSLPMAGAEILLGQAYWPSAKGWLITLFIAAGPSFAGQLCFMRSVDLIGPSRAGLAVNLVPIAGALTAVAVLHETFTPAHAVAVLLGLGGISLAEWRGPRRRSAQNLEAARDTRLP